MSRPLRAELRGAGAFAGFGAAGFGAAGFGAAGFFGAATFGGAAGAGTGGATGFFAGAVLAAGFGGSTGVFGCARGVGSAGLAGPAPMARCSGFFTSRGPFGSGSFVSFDSFVPFVLFAINP
jgi:general secretion pathway protein D